MDAHRLNRLLVLADSAFPTGAFAHSWGLEWAIRNGSVTDSASLAAWIGDAVRYGVAPLEGRAVARARLLTRQHPAGERSPSPTAARTAADAVADPAPAERRAARRLARLSDEVASFLPSREARAAAGQLGRSLLTAAGAAFAGLRRSSSYRAVVETTRDGEQRLQHPVAWGFLGAALDLEGEALVQAYLLNTVRQWTQVAMRTVPIGQTAALAVVGGLLNELAELAHGVIGTRRPLAAITPGWDLAVLGHGELAARYFRS